MEIKDKLEKLKKSGFFDLIPAEQTDFLRKNGFFNLSNEKKIEILESLGLFYLDINNDPPDIPLNPEDVDYLKEDPLNKRKNQIMNSWKESFTNNAIKHGELVIDKVNGISNALNVKSGAIVTCNHFSIFDTFAIERILKDSGINKKIYKVIREGNYTNFPGKYGLYFKHDNTLPLSQIPETMELFDDAINEILRRGDIVIVCPEQSMWADYKKPKPFKYGAFKWATINNVPVIPTFITTDENEHNNQADPFTIYIGQSIMPINGLLPQQNIKRMRNNDFIFCREIYEKVYGQPLEYKTFLHEDIPAYVTSTPDFESLISNNKELEK